MVWYSGAMPSLSSELWAEMSQEISLEDKKLHGPTLCCSQLARLERREETGFFFLAVGVTSRSELRLAERTFPRWSEFLQSEIFLLWKNNFCKIKQKQMSCIPATHGFHFLQQRTVSKKLFITNVPFYCSGAHEAALRFTERHVTFSCVAFSTGWILLKLFKPTQFKRTATPTTRNTKISNQFYRYGNKTCGRLASSSTHVNILQYCMRMSVMF